MQLTNNQGALSLPLEAFHSSPAGCLAGLDHQDLLLFLCSPWVNPERKLDTSFLHRNDFKIRFF